MQEAEPISSVVQSFERMNQLASHQNRRPAIIRDTAAISQFELTALNEFLKSHGFDPFILSEKIQVEFPGSVLRPLFVVSYDEFGNNEQFRQANEVADQLREIGYDTIVVPYGIQITPVPAQTIQSRPETADQSRPACSCCNGPDASLHTIQIDSQSCKGMGQLMVCTDCAREPFGFEDGRVTRCLKHRYTG